MFSIDDYDRICGGFPATHKVVQWRGAQVWKIGEKVFAIGREMDGGEVAVTFKVNDMVWEIYRDAPGVIPAPHLASRGMKWLQRRDGSSVDNAMLADLLAQSYQMVVANLTKKKRAELGV